MRTELQTELQEIKQLLLLNNKTVLTPDEVSLMYGLSKDYLYHLTSERVIPFHKPNGKKIFFDKEEVEIGCCRTDRIPSKKHSKKQRCTI